MTDGKINVEEIMMKIREQVREDLKKNPPTGQAVSALNLWTKQGASVSSTPVIHSEELHFLNNHWRDWQQAEPLASHRPVVGKVILAVKGFISRTVWKHVIGHYFDLEKNFHYHLVRFLNETAVYIDRRDGEVFEQLRHKIDHDTATINARMDRLFELAVSERIALSEELEQLRRLTASSIQAAGSASPEARGRSSTSQEGPLQSLAEK